MIGILPKATHAVISKNEFPGRSRWMLTVYADNGSQQTSWHRTQAEAVRWAKAVAGLSADRVSKDTGTRRRKNPRKGAVKFFYDNAGFSYDTKKETKEEGRRRSARQLAEAEEWLEEQVYENGWEVIWEHDEESPEGFVDDEDMQELAAGNLEYLWAGIVDGDGETVASLGGILVYKGPEGRKFGRVIEAELASEAMESH